MISKLKQKLNNKLILRIVFIIILAIILAVSVIQFLIMSHFNKENNLLLYTTEDGLQQIYILGTIHNEHFNKKYKYSIADIQNVINAVKPDLLLLEVRQETVEKYKALDGPIEMIYAWCYAVENSINVKGIDWWNITDDTKPNTTDNERDDNIFENTIESIGENKTVLIICGATHRVEQGKRFSNNGYIKTTLDTKQYFNINPKSEFTYPKTMSLEIHNKINYCQTGIIEEIINGTKENSKERKMWLKKANDLILYLKSVDNELVIPNKLYK